MRKTRIKVRAVIATCIDIRKAAQITVDNWYNKTTDMADSNGEAEIDPTNVELTDFGIHTKMSLANYIHKTRCKCSNNNLIILLIINIGTESTTYIEKSLIICH